MSESRCLAQFSHIFLWGASLRPNLIVALSAIILFGFGAAIFTTPAHAASPAQVVTPQTLILEPEGISDWIVGGGFLYWCKEVGHPSQTVLQRRAVNGTVTQTLTTIDSCGVLEYAAVDDSGLYFYNPAAAAIQAIYSHGPNDAVQTLLSSSSILGRIFLGARHIYWIEMDTTCRSTDDVCVPLESRLRRVAKDGSAPQTLYTEQIGLGNAGHNIGVAQGRLYWAEVAGLYTLVKPPCTPPPDQSTEVCTEKSVIHSPTTPLLAVGFAVSDHDTVFWWDSTDSSAPQLGNRTIYQTPACPASAFDDCPGTQSRYTAPNQTFIPALDANDNYVYWTERTPQAGIRLMRLSIAGGPAQILMEHGFIPDRLAIDEHGVYFLSPDQTRVQRLPHDAQAIQREISFRGWEVTQAIQNLENTAPLVAGKETYVRVYPQIDSGHSMAGMEALLHGSRHGVALDDSPLRPLNATIQVNAGASLEAQRATLDGGWLFRLPPEWTKLTDEPIPLDDAELTLRVELDPRGLTGDTTPTNNQAEDTFLFTAKAPTCIRLRSVWTEAPYQAPWDISVANLFELSESLQATVAYLPFPEYNRLERTKMCHGPGFRGYGPYCTQPYDLNEHRFGLLFKLQRKNYFSSPPRVCFEAGARTHLAGIVHANDSWSSGGYATYYGKVLLSKVPRYGHWSWPMTIFDDRATTFAHEIGHNFRRRHVDCGPGITGTDSDFPYATDTLDDGSPSDPATHFGYDTRLLQPRHPAQHRDYLSYCHPRWVSDYTWTAIFERTRPAGLPPHLQSTLDAAPESYMFVSGVVTSTHSTGELARIWTYPSAEAGASLVQMWQEDTAEHWRGTEPYHLRLLDVQGAVISDWTIVLDETFDQSLDQSVGVLPSHNGDEEDEPALFGLIIPAPAEPADSILLMRNETVLDTIRPSSSAPEITLLRPAGGETIDNALLVEWSAPAPDGAPTLEYMIQYSPDNGESWFVLESELIGAGQGMTESLIIDLEGQPGSGPATARLRVAAGDGYHTTLATSEPFTVTPRAPHVLITTPGEDQWFRADEPIVLRGYGFDPEDGVLPDHAYAWSIAPQDTPESINQRTPLLRGWAPGTYTTTLTATDSDGQRGEALAKLRIAPLDVPYVAELVLDGRCDDPGYGTMSLPLAPYADGEVAYAAVARTAQHLWVCLQGIQGDTGYAGFQIDMDNSQAAGVQPSDLGFFVSMDGTPIGLVGNGERFTPTAPDGLRTRVVTDGQVWSAELQLDVDAIGGWNRHVALAIAHYFGLEPDERKTWPRDAQLEAPQSWAQTNLFAGSTPLLAALDPISGTVGISTTVTMTGTGFHPDTVVLWNDTVVTSTYIDAETLSVQLDADQTNNAGFNMIRVAPGAAPDLAGSPRMFLLLHDRPTLSALSPATAAMGSDTITLNVHGSKFSEGATVLWNGDARATTFVDSTHLVATIDANDLATGRTVGVTVANPEPKLGIATPQSFLVHLNGEEEGEFTIFLPGLEAD